MDGKGDDGLVIYRLVSPYVPGQDGRGGTGLALERHLHEPVEVIGGIVGKNIFFLEKSLGIVGAGSGQHDARIFEIQDRGIEEGQTVVAAV